MYAIEELSVGFAPSRLAEMDRRNVVQLLPGLPGTRKHLATLVTLSFPSVMLTCSRLTAALYSLYISDRAQMFKLRAGLPGSTRPSLDASPRSYLVCEYRTLSCLAAK